MGNQELNAAENTTNNDKGSVSFDVAFSWTERNVLLSPRHRAPRDVEHTGTTVATIPSVTGAEAPVAFIATTKGYVNSDFADIESEYRLYDGRIFIPMTQGGEPTAVTPDWLLGRTAHWVDGTTAAASAEIAAQTFSGYLIIDGALWIAGKEPQYEVTTGGMGGNHGYTSFEATTRYTEGVADEHYFAADEYELALAKALDVAETRGDTRSVDRIKAYTPIRVLVSAAIGTTVKRAVRLRYARPYELTVGTFHAEIASFREQMKYAAFAVKVVNGNAAYDYSKLTARQTSDYKDYIRFGADHGLI